MSDPWSRPGQPGQPPEPGPPPPGPPSDPSSGQAPGSGAGPAAPGPPPAYGQPESYGQPGGYGQQPPYGQPGGYPGPAWRGPVPGATSGRATTVMVLGITAIVMFFFCGLGIIPAVIALVMARGADREIASSGGALQGTGQVRTGRIMSWIIVGLTALAIVVIVVLIVGLAAADTDTDRGALLAAAGRSL